MTGRGLMKLNILMGRTVYAWERQTLITEVQKAGWTQPVRDSSDLYVKPKCASNHSVQYNTMIEVNVNDLNQHLLLHGTMVHLSITYLSHNEFCNFSAIHFESCEFSVPCMGENEWIIGT